jgi:hypothetical protein
MKEQKGYGDHLTYCMKSDAFTESSISLQPMLSIKNQVDIRCCPLQLSQSSEIHGCSP